MLPTQVITIPFTGGLDTKTAEPLVNAANFLELENVVFTKTGALKKRWGYEAMSRVVENSTSRIGSLYGGASTPNEVLAFENDTAYAYMPATDRWASRGSVTSVVTTTKNVSAPKDSTLLGCEVAAIGRLRVYAWVESGASGYDVGYAVTDDDGRRYADGVIATSLSNPDPKVVVFGGKFRIFWCYSNTLASVEIDPNNPTTYTGMPDILDDVVGPWDIQIVNAPGGDRLVVAYDGDDGTGFPGCYIRSLDSTGSGYGSSLSTAPRLTSLYTAVKSISMTIDDSNMVWVTWATDDGASDSVVCAVNHYLLGATSSTVGIIDSGLDLNSVQRITGYVKPGESTLHVLCEVLDTSGPFTTCQVMRGSMTSGGSSPAVLTTVRRMVGLEARSFVCNGVAYAVLCTGQEFGKSALQPTYYVYDLDNDRFVSKFASGTGRGSRQIVRCAEWASVSDGVYIVPHAIRGRLISSGSSVYAVLAASATTIDLSSYRRYTSAYTDGLLLAGGIIQAYDGSSFLEYTPMQFPEGGACTAVGSGGSLGAGTYQYKMVYEIVDKSGMVRMSAASQAIDVTTVASDSVSVRFPVLHVTSDISRVNMVVYRTKKDEDVFFRVWDADEAAAAGLVPSASADFVTVVDTKADTAIDGNEPLYTTGGYLENISPPSATCIASYKSRTFLAGTPDANRIWFSKAVTPGFAAGFNDQLTIDVDPDGGPITALGVLDDKLIVFKHSRCYFVQGNGPDDAGQGFDFYPQSLSMDIGCTDPGSVVTIPGAIMFKSGKGIYAITSGLSVQYVGAPVERYNDQTVVSAVHVPDKSVVLFVCDEGKALVFDYVSGKWSTFTNHESVWCGVDQAENKLIVFRSDGTIQRQSDTLFTDSGNPVKMKVVTGWLAQGEQLGWQRVQRMALLGEYKSSHNLRVRFGYDFLPVYPQEATIPVSTIITTTTYGSGTYGSTTPYGGTYPAERFAIQLKKQKCLAVRVCIEDVNATGESLSLTGIAFRVGAKVGLNKQSHDRKIGAA